MKNERAKAFLDPAFLNHMVESGEGFSATLERLKNKFELVTDVHALQEVVYRYQLLGDTKLGYERATELRQAAEVFSVGKNELDGMDELMELYPLHTPRELLHVSAMRQHDIDKIICAPGSGYTRVEGLEALSPVAVVSSRY